MGIGPEKMKRVKKLEKADKLNIKKTKVKKNRKLRKGELVSSCDSIFPTFQEEIGMPIQQAIKFRNDCDIPTELKDKMIIYLNRYLDALLEDTQGKFYLNPDNVQTGQWVASVLFHKGTL